MSALSATLRIAQRDAWRHKARSTLIIAMVAIPVLGLTAADVLARTMQLSVGERVTREIGQADVAIQKVGDVRVSQGADPSSGYSFTGDKVTSPTSKAAVAQRAQVLAMVGARPAVTTLLDTSTTVVAHGLQVAANLTLVNLDNPLTAGIATVVSGHAPTTATQVAVTPHLAKRLGLTIGDSISVTGEPPSAPDQQRTIAGLVRNPNALSDDAVYGPAASQGDRRGAIILASTSRPVTWSEVTALNALGFVVTSRAVVEHPPAGIPVFNPQPNVTSTDRIGVATVAVGLAVLEVVLLAGAAFAVGARRQRRDLALVAATGGDARHVRRIVLAGGVVLGGVGAVVGLGAGIIVARLALSEVSRLVGRSPGHFDLRALELLFVLVLGVLTGVISSVLPARTAARDDVVATLSGRRGAVRTPRRVPAVGLTMVVLGAMLAVYCAQRYHFKGILTGAVVCELGFVICAPAVVGLAGRVARFLPLAPRLAMRDAARHRGRSGPAVAAIMAAIAGSIAVSTYFVSTVQRDRESYTPDARIGQPVLQVTDGVGLAQRRQAALPVFRNDLAASQVVAVPMAGCLEPARHCPEINLFGTATNANHVAVGGPALLRTLTGQVDLSAEQALSGGRVVAFSNVSAPLTRQNPKTGDSITIKGASEFLEDIGSSGAAVAGIMSPSTAVRLHLQTQLTTYVAVTPKVPTQAQEDRANDQLAAASATLTVERGFSPGNYSVALIALAVAAGLVTLGATAISVGLSMAESKPDLVTLAAVGGRPRTRRFLVANQAGTVALLGALQGVVAGVVPAWAILHASHVVPFVLPWTTILIVVVGIPLIAMAGTAAFAGSRLTLDRRLT